MLGILIKNQNEKIILQNGFWYVFNKQRNDNILQAFCLNNGLYIIIKLIYLVVDWIMLIGGVLFLCSR